MPKATGTLSNCVQLKINSAVIGYFAEPSVLEFVVNLLKEQLEEAEIPLELVETTNWFIEGEF